MLVTLSEIHSAGFVHDVKAGRERLWEFDAARRDEARRLLDEISAQCAPGSAAAQTGR